MKITSKKIKELVGLDEELTKLRDEVSEKLKQIKSEFGSRDIDVKDGKDGEVRTIQEKDAWREVYALGNNTATYSALREKYPELLGLSEKEGEKAKEFKGFVMKEFETDYVNMTFSQMIRLIIGIVEYTNNKKKNG